MHMRSLAVLGAAVLTIAGCGSDDDKEPAATPKAAAAESADLGAIKTYLLDHTGALKASTATLAEQGQAYYDMVKAANFDYAKLLASDREGVKQAVEEMQASWRKANPQYEEAEGVVAGVPSLAEFDTILDAGSDASDPESAVPFDLKLPTGKVLKQPGNFFFLTETSLFGTNEAFQAKGVEADLDGDGKVAFPEAVPDANLVQAATHDMADQASRLDAAARAWEPTQADAFQALVTMTPTMSEYFGQWKTSRFIAGSKADEASFAASSRLADIEGILSGLVLIYDNIEPMVSKADPGQAEQTGQDLKSLYDFAADLRAKEDGGTTFTAEQADALGAEAQSRAEAIAGQVSQAAG